MKKTYQLPIAKNGSTSLLITTFIILFLCFFSNSVQSQVTINNAQTFAALDAGDGSADGVFSVAGDLTVTATGSISGNPTGGNHMKFAISGNLLIEPGGIIKGDVNGANRVGDSITVWAVNISLKGNAAGTNGGKITSNQVAGSCSGGKGGNIYLNASKNINTEKGSVISADAKCPAGDIVMLAPGGEITIDGLVQSKSGNSGTGVNQRPGGGPITMVGNCKLAVTDNGKVNSEGQDAGADLVHLEACQVVVWGLVQSTAVGHAVPSNPVTHLVPPNRPDKPANSTAGVEIWGSTIDINKIAPHNGEVNANLTTGAAARAWIDLLASGSISINGAASGTYAVHSNIGGNNGKGGIITVKSTEGAVTASGWAIQSNGVGSGFRAGGPVTVECKNDLSLCGVKVMEAIGVNLGGTVALSAFGTLPGSGNILKCPGTTINVANGGTVTENSCTPGAICGGNPSLASQPYVNLPAANCGANGCRQDQPCVCITCDGEVVVTNSLTINLNVNNPTVAGPLAPYFSFVKPPNTTADQWKAVFNLGGKKLVVKSPATITLSTVNGYAPGIEINTTCDVLVENGAAIKVISVNRNAGDIVVNASGVVTIDGEVTNQVTGTLGLPGAITINSKCANMDVRGLVQILGVDGGGNLITLLTCSPCPPYEGDIIIDGLVKSYAHAHAGDLTLNRPNIRVVSMSGRVVINANTVEPLYDEFSVGGGKYDIYGGLLSWVTANVNPGNIKVQAQGDVIVNGHGSDPTGTVRTSYGAIAAIATASSSPGGSLNIHSLGGKIIGNDRAFDVSGRNRLATNFAHIVLNARDNIELNRLGANNNFNPVADASGKGAGDNGGVNDLRSYSGSILIGANAQVTAAALGTNGANNYTHCTGFTNNGSVAPAAVVSVDCTVPAPDALYTNCPDIGVFGANQNTSEFVSRPSMKNIPTKTALLSNYPNPFSKATTISYDLAKPGYVTLKVYDITGKEMATIVQENQAAGRYQYQWISSRVPAGEYYARLKAGDFSGVNKLVLTK